MMVWARACPAMPDKYQAAIRLGPGDGMRLGEVLATEDGRRARDSGRRRPTHPQPQ